MAATEPLLTYRQVAEMLSMQESRLRYWAQTGLVGPSVRTGGRQLFTFCDVVQVKAAQQLSARGIAVQRVRKTLEALRGALPGVEQPLSRLRVCSDGEGIVVLADDAAFEPETGQVVMEFGLGPLSEEVAGQVAPATPADAESAYESFARGLAAEDVGDLAAAERFYRRALALDPPLAAAQTNLGNVLYARGLRERAREAYERALELDAVQTEAHYNLANVLVELGEREIAVAQYRRALALDPDCGDAHFNLATVLEAQGDQATAREHYERYLELSGEDDEFVGVAREALGRIGRQ